MVPVISKISTLITKLDNKLSTSKIEVHLSQYETIQKFLNLSKSLKNGSFDSLEEVCVSSTLI